MKPGCIVPIRWKPGTGWIHERELREYHMAAASREAVAAMRPAYDREYDLYNEL